MSSPSHSVPPVSVDLAPESARVHAEPEAHLKRAARGAVVETAGYVTSLALRFGSNLILTRLVQPEIFGLLAMMQLILFSLFMLADVGLSQAVVQSPKGDDDEYLNTIWSMQLVRGLGLTVACLLVTWPAALWFREPRMLWIVPLASVNNLIHGFTSTRVFSCSRHLRVWPLLRMDLIAQVIGVSINLLGAYYGYGLLALLIGQIVASVFSAVASHWLPGTHRDRWQMNPALRREVLQFGRWIFFSSALTVVSSRGDSALLGRLLGPASLGLYNLAANIADLPDSFGLRLTNSVIFPTLSRTYGNERQNFVTIYYRLRLYFDAVAHTALGGLCAMAVWLFGLLYDERYYGAGPMLSAFAVRSSFALMAYPWESAFFASGVTHFQFRRSLLNAASLMIMMPLGFHWFGAAGVIWGTVFARATPLLVLWPAAHVKGWIRYHRELLVPVFFALGYALGTGALSLLPRFSP